MEETKKKVKLHATVMQSKLRNTNRSEEELPFDAEDIIRVRLHTRGDPYYGV